MEKDERLLWLIQYLLAENTRYSKVEIPDNMDEQFNLYRSLVNVRMPAPISEEYLNIEDEYNLESIAFCCISTGEFHFPNDKAAQIAVHTVKEYKEKTNSKRI